MAAAKGDTLGLVQHQGDYHTPRIVGHCVGSPGKPCGRPLASTRHAKALGAWPNEGGMRCRTCVRRFKRHESGMPDIRKQGLPLIPIPGPWSREALCAEVDPDRWFPEKGESAKPAKLICRGCVVVNQCRAFALEHRISDGVWGGLSWPERERMLAGQVAA